MWNLGHSEVTIVLFKTSEFFLYLCNPPSLFFGGEEYGKLIQKNGMEPTSKYKCCFSKF